MNVITVVRPLHQGESAIAPPLPQGVITPEKIPPAPRPQPVPLVRLIMPALMILLVIGMLFFMLRGGANPMMALFPLMMVASMLGMGGGMRAEDLDEQRRAFMRHVEVIRHKAHENAHQQRLNQMHYHPDPEKLWSMLGSRRMWEREADAFPIRVGTATTGLCTPIEVPDSGATEDLDPVCSVAMRQFVAAYGTVPDMPLVLEMGAFARIHFTGAAAMDGVRALVCQLLFHYGPEVLSISWDTDEWDWLKWTPHSIEQAEFHVHVGNTPPPDTNCVLAFGANSDEVTIEICGESATISMDTPQGVEKLGQADRLSHDQAEYFARALTGYRRPMATEQHTTVMTNLDWSPRGRMRLKVPIGVDNQGKPVLLDLKEHAQGGVGPHGLCIGATGSGKSELLRTLVVALASTHSPEALNLVLVDFKGGATFLGLDGLPHTSAVITNLSEEATLVERMQDAINGEMTRRQEVLRRAGNFANVSAYNKAYYAGELAEEFGPMPALLIILDEFSELLGQHPDFADLFVAVGRLGRSLEMHLLLASQRLEEGKLRGLDSHLSYRIGLKTFSASESRQVLGVPDAYSLPAQPGLGYLKVDADEPVRFKADYVSGPVEEISEAAPAPMVAFQGWHSLEYVHTRSHNHNSSKSIADLIVDASRRAAGEMRAHKIWLDPLPPNLSLGALTSENPKPGFLRCVLGLIDRPAVQRQDPLIMDLQGAGGHVAVCGGPQSGKSTALRSIALSLAGTHSTDELRFYCIGSEFDSLAGLPHVAAVASDPERIRAVIDEVSSFVDQPEERHTLLFIDGWHNLNEDYGDILTHIASDGLAARVHLIVSTPRWGGIRMAARDSITNRIELKLSDPMDSLVEIKSQKQVPEQPGRGISYVGEQIMVASASEEESARIIDEIRARGEQPVPVLKELPQHIMLSELPLEPGAITLGLRGAGLVPATWNFVENPFLFIAGNRGSGKSTALATIVRNIEQMPDAQIVMLDHKRSHLGLVSPSVTRAYSASSDASSAAISDLVDYLSLRLPQADTTPEQLRTRSWWQGPHIFLLIDDLDVLPDMTLSPLQSLIPYARDIGLSIVIARNAGGLHRALYQPVIGDIKDQSPTVLLLDTDPDEGSVLGIRTTHQPPGRGHLGPNNLILVARPEEKGLS
ncbi:MAG: type VII secretion protein EccCb [Corynebacterium sp.]|nr:type VII secretion protein EccCb [Corynebacterium sp.]